MLPEMRATHEATEETGGKNLAYIATGTVERFGPGPGKTVFDVVTDDGTLYRFTQQLDGEPFQFEPGNGDDDRAGKSGLLPEVVEAILDAEFTDDDGDPDPGWMY